MEVEAAAAAGDGEGMPPLDLVVQVTGLTSESETPPPSQAAVATGPPPAAAADESALSGWLRHV